MTYSKEKVIQTGEAEEGYLEKKSNDCLDSKTDNAGDKNFTKYWRDLYEKFQGQPWCLCWVIWIFVMSFGEEVAKKLLYMTSYTFYTPTAADNFKKNNAWFTEPKVGDLIFFKNSTRIHHVGFVYKVDNNKVYTIEGNTSAGAKVIPNGGAVCKKSYALNNASIAGYGRPCYGEEEKTNSIQTTPVTCDRKGLEVVGAISLNIRETPKNGKIVGTYKGGQLIQAIAMTVCSDNKVWFQTDRGWVSANYLDGWVKFGEIWKYLTKGYKFLTSIVKEIDGKEYAFNKNGNMITKDDINTDGSLK